MSLMSFPYYSFLIILSFLTNILVAFSSNRFNSGIVISLLTTGLFCITFALYPNLRVLKDSSWFEIEGEHVIMSIVLLFPPKESLRILVSLLSLYGIWVLVPSVSCLITCPRTVNDLLIFLASSNLRPVAPVFPTFSDPAKSTKNSFPVLTEKSIVLV